ncbi:MAG TPA: Gfo/Idh/MocA family oxidoreductase [Candidatus Methylacidiphilales bacterium]|jgi:predicted dehydrogenase|nr:Gfo/Idh/MocA family oxidoreductase [Candidatus Methylacidiphilales bacterium]
MNTIRIGIVGLGNMGRGHARNILDHKVPGLHLAAVADPVPQAAETFPGIPAFATPETLIASGKVDAVLIATPHYSHTAIGIAALRAGLHVLVEKPISVHKADAEKLIAAHTDRKLVFAAMFNQRTDPYYLKIREMMHDGTLGTVRRINWTITNWFRTAAYYASGSWRATWAGEGGGILLNQCPHNLDLFSWMFGQPDRVRAFCQFGRYHDIEVEDDVTGYFEYNNGTTATFIATTGEAPGTNRLEVAAENGRLIMENDKLLFTRNEMPMSEFSRTTTGMFSAPKTTEEVFTFPDHGDQHIGIMRNFAEAIASGAPLLAPAAEGVFSVELANAMLLSAFEDRRVELPLDGPAYARALQSKIDASPRTPKT